MSDIEEQLIHKENYHTARKHIAYLYIWGIFITILVIGGFLANRFNASDYDIWVGLIILVFVLMLTCCMVTDHLNFLHKHSK